jgi:uncharacterized coiled-coil DUF342 family protein
MNDDVTHRNILAISSYSEETRKEFRDLEKEVKNLQKQILQLRAENATMKTQLQALQVRIFSGGATSGNNY